MSRDWLENEPEDFLPAVLENEQRSRETAVALVHEAKAASAVAPLQTTTKDLMVPSTGKKLSEVLKDDWKKLDAKQRFFLLLARENHFNIRKTVRVLEAQGDSPDRVTRSNVRQWREKSDAFNRWYKHMQSVESGTVIDRDRLLLRADEIADEALGPKPILHRGRPTGFYENQPDVALRANEQLMKAAGMLKGDEKATRVTVRLVNLAGSEAPNVIEGEAEVIE